MKSRCLPAVILSAGASLLIAFLALAFPAHPLSTITGEGREMKLQADTLFNREKWEKAGAVYSRLAKHSSGEDRSYAEYRAGLCILKQGKHLDAVNTWQKLLFLDKETEWSALAMEQSAELYMDYFKKKAKGIELYERLVETFPNRTGSDGILHKVAMLYFNDADYSRALPGFQELLQRYPQSSHAAQARQYVTICQKRLNQPSKVITTAQKEKELADKLYSSAHYEEARKKYGEIATRFRSWDEGQYAAYRVGMCLFQQTRYREAIETWDDFRKNFAGSKYARDALAGTARTYCFYLNDIGEGLRRYELLLRTYPEAGHSMQIQYEVAGAYYTKGRWEEAREYFQMLLKEHPNCNVARQAKECLARCEQEISHPNRHADILYAAAKYTDAAELYEKVAISRPDALEGQEAQFKAGVCLANSGDFNRAIDKWRYFQAFCPDSPWADDALERTGRVQAENLGKVEDGTSTHEKLLEKYPKSPLAPGVIHWIGMVWFELGRYDKAEQAFRRELTLYPEATTANVARAFLEKKDEILKSQIGPLATAELAKLMIAGDLFYESGEYQRAQRNYEAILKKWPTREEGEYALYQLGNCNHFQWRAKEAIRTWEKLLNTHPKSKWADDALLMMGTVYVGPLGNRKKGEECFRKVVETYPNGSDAPLAQHYIGMLYLWDGKFEDALKEFGRELALYPETEFSGQTKLIAKGIKDGTYKGVHRSR